MFLESYIRHDKLKNRVISKEVFHNEMMSGEVPESIKKMFKDRR